MIPNVKNLKQQAVLLHAALKESFGPEVKLSLAYELLAKSHGMKDWNTLCALAKTVEEAGAA